MRGLCWLFVTAGLAAADPVAAQAPDPAIVKATAGSWLAATDDGAPGCRITLSAEPAIGGYGAAAEPGCPAKRLAGIAAWRFGHDGKLVLADAARRTIVALEENEAGYYREAEDKESVLYLVKARPGADRLPHARDLFGVWELARPAGPVLCRLRLLDRPPPGGEESFAVRVEPGCDRAVAGLKLASWRIEAVEVVLYGTDGASLAFVPAGPGRYEKAAREGGRPLLMLKR